MNNWESTFVKEPVFHCPLCNDQLHTEFVDNGFGPYAVQVSPYYCEPCKWVEGGCPAEKCIREKCFSWETCRGESIISKAEKS